MTSPFRNPTNLVISSAMNSRTLACTLGLLALPALTFAHAGDLALATSVSGTVDATTAAGSVKVTLNAKAVARADQEIDRRIKNLNDLSARIGEMQKVSDANKASIQGTISAQIADLSTLKAKIDADTVLSDLKTDVQSITKAYRIYMLILPQIRMIAAADRVATVAGQMAALEVKLAARITSSTGDTSSLLAADADLKTKLIDANNQAQAAVNVVIALKPDNGDATIAASNRAALKDAQSKIKAAVQDFMAARKDIDTILKGLRSMKASAGGSATASTSAGTQ